MILLKALSHDGQPLDEPVQGLFFDTGDQPGATIGSAPGNRLVLGDAAGRIAAQQARVQVRGGRLSVVNLGANAFEVDGQPLAPGGERELRLGSRLRFAGWLVEVQPEGRILAGAPATPVSSSPPPRAGRRGVPGLGGILKQTFERFFPTRSPPPVEAPRSMPAPWDAVDDSTRIQAPRPRSVPPDDDAAMTLGSAAPAASSSTVEPVRFAAAAPRACVPGQPAVASLVVYVEGLRDAALRRLADYGESGDRVISDVAPSTRAGWLPGAPVRVRAWGQHLQVTPPERRFDWSGSVNDATFELVAYAEAAGASTLLHIEVLLADVVMADIPLRIEVGASGAAAAAAPAASPVRQGSTAEAPTSVFASYSSRDAAEVGARLSALTRWTSGLDVFQDCLDLKPGEDFKPQLAAQIARRERFLLFWSRHAAASPWVRWEFETALRTRGLAAVLPMPLEDPALAPPPPELAGLHLRDRYLIAAYAMQQIDQQRNAAPPA